MASIGGGAATTFPGGIGTTVAGGGGSVGFPGGQRGGGGQFGGMPPWFANALQQRTAQQLQQGELATQGARLQNRMGQFSLEEAQRASRQARAPKLETWDSETGMTNAMRRDAMEQSRLQTAMMRAQAGAQTQGPPMRQAPMQGGTTMGWTMDPQAMSGAQRQAFLPQGSEFGGIPSGGEAFALSRGSAQGQQAADEWGAQRTYGLMQSGFLPGMQVPQGWAGPQSPQVRAMRGASLDDQLELERRRQQYGLFNPSPPGGGLGGGA